MEYENENGRYEGMASPYSQNSCLKRLIPWLSNNHFFQTSLVLSESANANASASASGVLLLAQPNVTMIMQESVRATTAQDEIEVLHQMGEWILGTTDITHIDTRNLND